MRQRRSLFGRRALQGRRRDGPSRLRVNEINLPTAGRLAAMRTKASGLNGRPFETQGKPELQGANASRSFLQGLKPVFVLRLNVAAEAATS